MNRSPKYSLLEAKQKIEAWCAYQERCDFEVRQKLHSWNLHNEDVDILISDLITNNFLNEERFAEAYVSGKFRIKKWGRIKIRLHLKQKKISNYSIDRALSQIDEEEYLETLKNLANKKIVSAPNNWERKQKIKYFLQQKGFEHTLIDKVLTETP